MTQASPRLRPARSVRARGVVAMLGLALAVTGCGNSETAEAPISGDAVKARAVEAQTARRRTGAEVQDRALNRVVRAVYLCNNGERLSVDFDNPRQMATVRTSAGEAIDLYLERAADGIWYRSSGYDLRGRGALATWLADGREPTECRAID
jgi:hypothetical protein